MYWFDVSKGRFTGTISQRWSGGLFSLVAMYASRFGNFLCAEWNRIGGTSKKSGSQKTRASLRREIHAAQEVLEARAGARGLFQLCVLRLGFLQDGDVGVGVFPERKEILIRGPGFGGVALQGVSARGLLSTLSLPLATAPSHSCPRLPPTHLLGLTAPTLPI